MTSSQRALESELANLRGVLSDKEVQISKQKNEWAEIYGSMKQEIEVLK